jgi:MtaA/CmuA family methyltransferase
MSLPSDLTAPPATPASMQPKERFLAALAGRPVDRVPVFPLLMFLAVDRAGLTYRQFATDGHALAEAQLLMQERFGLDAITACSDAFRLSADLGGEMVFPETKPPYLASPLVTSAAGLAGLGHPAPDRGRMGDRLSAISHMARAVGERVAVLGWVDMPFAEACSVCGVSNFMLMLKDDPAGAHRILAFLTGPVIEFGVAQVGAGALMVGAGDAAASLISRKNYLEFALPYEQQVCAAVHAAGGLVKLHICGNTTHLLEPMATCGADLFNVDHLVPLEQACRVYAAHGKCCKGNLNPVTDIMQATPEECARRTHECLAPAAGAAGGRYMLSAGCEIPAETRDDVFLAFCQAPLTSP